MARKAANGPLDALPAKLLINGGPPVRYFRRWQSQLFGVSTIERWCYQALAIDGPVLSLGCKVRTDAGSKRSVGKELVGILHDQYRQFRHWRHNLHADNLAAFLEQQPELGDVPSYSSVKRSSEP